MVNLTKRKRPESQKAPQNKRMSTALNKNTKKNEKRGPKSNLAKRGGTRLNDLMKVMEVESENENDNEDYEKEVVVVEEEEEEKEEEEEEEEEEDDDKEDDDKEGEENDKEGEIEEENNSYYYEKEEKEKEKRNAQYSKVVKKKAQVKPSLTPTVTYSDEVGVWRAAILKLCHASFFRHRKPAPDRIRAMVKKIAVTASPSEYQYLYESARKAFENMRDDYMRETRNLAEKVKNKFMNGDNLEKIPSNQEILKCIPERYFDKAFQKTLNIIDIDFLKKKPVTSKYGTVKSFLMNLMAVSIVLHIETSLRVRTKEEVANYIYNFDKETDSDDWVAPLDPFTGNKRSRATISVEKRTFTFYTDDGTTVDISIGE